MKPISKKKFVEKADRIWTNTFDYKDTIYINNRSPITIKHIACNRSFTLIRAVDHTKTDRPFLPTGCPLCCDDETRNKMMNELNKTHPNNIYDFSNMPLVRKQNFIIKHNKCGKEFPSNFECLIRGQGCKHCFGKFKSVDILKERGRSKYGDKYNYSRTGIVFASKGDITVECLLCGNIFIVSCKSHLYFRKECPCQGGIAFSKIAITWLENLSDKFKIFIQTGKNNGEERLNLKDHPSISSDYYSSHLSADGIIQELTCPVWFDFWGCFWHGCPKCFPNDRDKPIKKGEVGIYTCGPTVYNHVHIGNLRAYVFADVLQRYLKYSGYKVNWVLNITDIEDKIIRDYKKSGKKIGRAHV